MYDRSPELRGLILSGLIALVLGSFLAVLVYITPLRETLLDSLANLIMIIAVFAGGSYVAKTRGSRGLIGGMTLGILFFVLMFILTLIFSPSLPGFKSFLQNFFFCLISGALGGIFGIGMSD